SLGLAAINHVDLDSQARPAHLLKPSALAARLGVSRTWLYEAAKSGRIPCIRIGGDDGPLRFVPEDIDRWINEARAAWSPGAPAHATSVTASYRARARPRAR